LPYRLDPVQRLKDPGLSAMAHHQQSTTLVYLGQAHDFFEQRERMCALYDAERDRPLVYQLGFDPQVASLSHAGWAHWFLGYLTRRDDEARRPWASPGSWGIPLLRPLHCFLLLTFPRDPFHFGDWINLVGTQRLAGRRQGRLASRDRLTGSAKRPGSFSPNWQVVLRYLWATQITGSRSAVQFQR
jgi:hypothetical protein